MSTPAVSVNICVWKPDPVYFRQAVESILAQTLQDFELVIVEDPSEKDGRAMIADLLHDPRIRYIQNRERTGLIAQRNLALELSCAPWIAILDADDVAKPQRLAKQMEYLAVHPDVSVLGSYLEVIDGQGRPVGIRRYPTDHAAIARAMRRYNPIAQPAVVFSKTQCDAVGANQGQGYGRDYDLWCRMLISGCIFANLPDLLTQYRIHSGASKRHHLRDVLRKTVETKKRYFAHQFTAGDRLRLLAERWLLLLPPQVVYWLFCKMTYHRSVDK